MSAALEFRRVSILFTQSRGSHRNLGKAEEALREGATRADIASQFGIVVGVFDASLRVETGQICVLVGLSGSGKSTLPARGQRAEPGQQRRCAAAGWRRAGQRRQLR